MEVNVSCDLRQLMADSRKASRAFRHAFGELVDLAYWTFEKLIDLTPKSGRSREGDRVADSWELTHGLNPGDASDNSSVMTNGYTAIENYINELADQLIP